MDRWLLLFSYRYLLLWYRFSFRFPCFFHICLLLYTIHSSYSTLFLIRYLLFPAFLHSFLFQTTKALQIRQYMILHICQIFHILLKLFIPFAFLIVDPAFVRQSHFILQL